MTNETGNIEITPQQAQQISAILNELPIRELAKVEAIVKIFNSDQSEESVDDVEEIKEN